jgi:hypothetical protein
MEEEFYSTIKLSTGEELIAKVCYLPDEDSLLVEKPMIVEALTQKKNGKKVQGFILKEWIRSSYDEMFVVKMEQIVTMSELDEKIKRFYLGSLDKDDRDENKIKPTKLKNNGYVGSVEEVKKNLESLFKRS